MVGNSKILFLDIETAPALAYVWRLFDVNIGLDQLVSPSRVLCVSAKWAGDKTCYFFAEWQEGGRQAMLQGIYEMMHEADAIVTYNGDKFDLPKLMGEFVLAGMKPPAPSTSIDILKTVRKLGLQSNKLAFVGPLLAVGKKVKHEGFSLWISVLNGNEAARGRMERYCIQDSVLLEKVYKKLRPFVKNHPHIGKGGECGACGSTHTQSRGYRYTKTMKIQRQQCQACGAWSDGIRSKIK